MSLTLTGLSCLQTVCTGFSNLSETGGVGGLGSSHSGNMEANYNQNMAACLLIGTEIKH